MGKNNYECHHSETKKGKKNGKTKIKQAIHTDLPVAVYFYISSRYYNLLVHFIS